MKTNIALTSILFCTILVNSCEREIKNPHGILVNSQPMQKRINTGMSWQKDEYTFTALAEFQINAVILDKENYSHDRESDISPVDLALGWGRMSDQSVIDKLKFSQRNRWYYWKTDNYPIPKLEIDRSSANMHMIPKDETIEELLDGVVKGNLIAIKGYLVKVTASDGWRWISSLSREDTGGGACEIVWVEQLQILN